MGKWTDTYTFMNNKIKLFTAYIPGPRAPFNILAGVIDVNTVYGSTDKHARLVSLLLL